MVGKLGPRCRPGPHSQLLRIVEWPERVSRARDNPHSDAVGTGCGWYIHVPGLPADRACLLIGSPALIDTPGLSTSVASRYGRILEGLSRQLRNPLERDGVAGTFKVCFPIVPDAAEPAEN